MISGTVTDPQSAAVVGATVVVTSTDRNTSIRLTTNASGYYEAPLLLPGKYQVTVEAAGFKKIVRSGLTLVMSEQLQINLQLEIGALSEAVTVTAESPILETSTVTTGKVVTQRELMDLPVMTNDIVTLARIVPGVVNQGTTQYLTQGMIGGSSGFYMPLNLGGNEWTIDGAPNNGLSRNQAFTPYTDMVAEFKVETSNFDASFGHALGLNVSFASKSGTNQVHGTATEQYWNQRWNANPFFVKKNYYQQINAAETAGDRALADKLRSQPMRPGGHSNNYGATITAPVYIPKVFDGRNRLFFFFAFSQAKDRQPARPGEINFTVPTMAQRQGDFSQLLKVDPVRYQVYDPLSVKPDPARATHYIRTPFAGNIIPPSRILMPKVYDFYTKRIPVPNNDPLSPAMEPWNNYLAYTMPDNTNYKAYQNRIDYQLSEKHRFFFRWNWSLFYEDAQDWTNAVERGLHSWDEYRKNVSGVVDWTYAKSAATVLNVNVASNLWWQRQFHEKMMSYKPSDAGFPKYVDDKCATLNACALPRMDWSVYNEITWPVASFPRQRSQGIKLNLSHIRGAHSLRAGIDFRQHYKTDPGGGGSSAGYFSFGNSIVRKDDDGNTPAGTLGLNWATFLLGMPTGISIDTNTSMAMINPYYAWYGQDTWRLTRNLTVTLGLRLEYELGPTERYNQMVTYFDRDAKLPIADAAVAAYAASPIPETPVSSFVIKGGSLYAGQNGAPRNQWQNELMWLPRLSAAWQFHPKMVLRGGYGIYFDTLNVMNEGVTQYGYSRATSPTITTDFGSTWRVGNPGAGISPLADPFPVRADGTRFDKPFGNALGYMAYAGRGFGYTPYERKHPRIERWRIGVQRQLTTNMVVEAAYWGQWAGRLGVGKNLSALPEQYWATGNVRNDAIPTELNRNLTNPFNIKNFAFLQSSDPLLYQQISTIGFFTSSTIRKNTLMRAYPNMNGLSTTEYIGKARTHSLEINFERRFSKGFNLTASYTRATAEWWNSRIYEFDPAPRFWLPGNSPLPHRLIVTGIYEFPVGKGRRFLNRGILSHVIGNWQTALTYEFQSGPAQTGWGDYFYYGDISKISEELRKGAKTLDQWFNTGIPIEKSASKGPAAYHLRTFPWDITAVRADGLNQWNANLRRDFQLWKEGARLELRLDALNLQNRSQFTAPDMSPYSTNFGKITSQTSSTNRFYQIQARIQF